MPLPVDTVKLTLTDGREREFLLTMGGVRRLKQRFGAKNFKVVLEQDAEAAGVPILYEALLDKQGMSEEQFAELVPAHMERVIRTLMQLLGQSFPDSDPTNPTLPTAIQ